MSKYTMIFRPTDAALAAGADGAHGGFDFGEVLETIGRLNQELIRAGVLLAAEGPVQSAESRPLSNACR